MVCLYLRVYSIIFCFFLQDTIENGNPVRIPVFYMKRSVFRGIPLFQFGCLLLLLVLQFFSEEKAA